MKCFFGLILTLLAGVGLGFLLATPEQVPWLWRLSFHIYSFAVCFVPDSIIRLLAKKPVQIVTGFMLTQLLRLLGLLILYIFLIFIHEAYAYLALWIFLASAGAFLCFQVVRAAYPHFCGGEQSLARFKT